MRNGNVLKKFIRPVAEPYQFTEAADLEEELLSELFVDRPPQESPTGWSRVTESEPEETLPPAEPDARSSSSDLLEFARVQAEAILSNARAEAEEVTATAAAEFQKELEQIREGARQEGLRQGYAQGLASATEEVMTQREELAGKMEKQLQTFLENVSLAQDEMIDSTKDDMCALAITVAEKVVRVSLKSSSGIIARMIQDSTEKLKRREWVHIYVAGCDAKGIAQVTPRLTRALSALSDHIKIVPMVNEESGTCIIETPDTIIDASASTQMSNIRSMLENMSPDDDPTSFGLRRRGL